MRFLLEHINEIDISDVGHMCFSSQASSHALKTCKIDNDTFYLKFANDGSFSSNDPSLQVLIEYLAYKIYGLYSGVLIPSTIHLVYDAKKERVGLATSAIKGKSGLLTMPPKKLGSMLSAGIFVDIFLANWDVIGQDDGNIVVTKDTATRIDPGAALTFRAQGQRKKLDPKASELETMLDPSFGYGAAGRILQYGDMKTAAKTFMSVSYNSIKQIIATTNKEIMVELRKRDMLDLLSQWSNEIKSIEPVLQKRHKAIQEHIKFIFEK